MLPKKYRLKKEKDFENVFKKGRLLQNKFLVVRFLKTKSNFNRFGIVVSSKVSKKATERNKIKRRVWFLIKREEILLKKGFDFVIIIKKDALAADKDDFNESFKIIFDK